MTREDRLPLNELLQKAGDGDFLRAVAESVLQLLMEADVEGLIGAGRHEQAADRLNWRNGYRDRTLDTRLARWTPTRRIRRSCGPAGYFPPFLEARKTTEKALVAVHPEAWIGGVSRRAGSTRSRRRWGFPASRNHGLETVQGNRRAREGVPRTSARRRLALCRSVQAEGARGRTRGRRDNRCGRQHRGTARDRRARHWPGCGKPRLLGGLPEAPDQARPARRQARDLGRARRAEGRRRAGRRRNMATLSRALHAQCAGLRAKDARRLSPPPSARPSSSPTARRRARSRRHVADQLRPGSRNSAS